MIIAMLVMAVLLMAGTTFLTISSTESQIAANERAATQAFLLAEAAVHKTVAQLNANPGYTGEANTALGGGTFTITVATASLQKCPANAAKDLVAVAKVPVGGGYAQAQIQATVDRISYPFNWGAYAATSDLILSSLFLGSSVTDSFDSSLGAYPVSNRQEGGHVGANGSVYLAGNVQVNGNVRAGGSISSVWGATVNGTKAAEVSMESFPSVTPGATPSTGLTVASGGTVNLTQGTYYYTTMSFGDGASLTTSGGAVTIYVTGTVTLGNSVTLGAYPGTVLSIITKSDGTGDDTVSLTAGSNFTLYGSLYGTNTNITLGDGGAIYGSIIGRRIAGPFFDAWNVTGTSVHFDQAMLDLPICHAGRYTIRRGSWHEVTS